MELLQLLPVTALLRLVAVTVLLLLVVVVVIILTEREWKVCFLRYVR